MKKAIVITAYDRLRYFQAVLDSWRDVRGLENWHILFSIDPSSLSQHMIEECEEFVFHAGLTDYEIRVNDERLGVLEHPYQALDYLFTDYEFVIRAEDDLLVGEDILEFFEWAAYKYERDEHVGTVHGYTEVDGPINEATDGWTFSPWVWGTWSDRWFGWMRPTWDRDYSTGPSGQHGWDWNINRMFSLWGLSAVSPLASRVQNIGEVGAHATKELFVQTTSFQRHRPSVKWECR